jgi:site-specific DNA-methyltransferase (adenine-specific)
MDVLWRMGQRLEEAGFRVDFSFIGWVTAQGFPKAQATDKLIDKRFGAEREIIAEVEPFGREGRNVSGKPKFGADGWDTKTTVSITAPVTEKAKEFFGSYVGFQPKPALEVIIVCEKPLSQKTYVDQALENGKGCTWLSDCKIPYAVDDDTRIGKDYKHHAKAGLENGTNKNNNDGELLSLHNPDGRFPANLLVSDNILDRGIITKSTGGKNLGGGVGKKVYGNYSGDAETAGSGGYKDTGDFSRYFSLDAWWQKKITELPEEQQKTFPFLIDPKPSKSEKNKYIENKHPTVKPLKLMSYLITMGSREGDTILDPFAGSGTTLEACRLLNRVFIGIDKDPANEPLMKARGQINITPQMYDTIVERVDESEGVDYWL